MRQGPFLPLIAMLSILVMCTSCSIYNIPVAEVEPVEASLASLSRGARVKIIKVDGSTKTFKLYRVEEGVLYGKHDIPAVDSRDIKKIIVYRKAVGRIILTSILVSVPLVYYSSSE